jgi:hypothetical protein
VDFTVLARECEQPFDLFGRARDGSGRRRSRVQQPAMAPRQEAVIDEVFLVDRERPIAPLQVPVAIALNAMSQDQVLRTRRGADRIGLHEPEALDGAPQRRRREQRPGDRITAQDRQVECAGS